MAGQKREARLALLPGMTNYSFARNHTGVPE
jgi:hypothetical protein